MTRASLLALEEDQVRVETPHLSHSRVNKYLTCPEQYRLYYVEKLRPRLAASSLVFGQVVHQALAGLFRDGQDPIATFTSQWTEAKDWSLAYKYRESWERLHDTGRRLLDRFVSDATDRLSNIRAVEEPFRLQVTGVDEPFIGIIDLVAALRGVRTLIDFKTSGKAYEPHEVLLSDQLTAYQLAKPDADQSALCVLVKTKVPKIEWHVAKRTSEHLMEYLGKLDLLAHDISAGRFFKRPGKWCSWCDYLPVCVGDSKTAKETLIQID